MSVLTLFALQAWSWHFFGSIQAGLVC